MKQPASEGKSWGSIRSAAALRCAKSMTAAGCRSLSRKTASALLISWRT
ncbi:hypothetical protein J7E23_12635 [Pseudomonas sp. ISL-88]|nr:MULTISPECIES: hypothetical protein [Bacteria]MBT2634126.1 hypothetical protein [Bacillus sp. ISL-26]MBT2713694.1 hypothetical protein [Pseudomonas sp. ISL-88]